MADIVKIEGALKESLLKAPEALLDDREVMRALVGANERAMGPNVVDMRGLAMDRLEGRLGRLEETHQVMIAAACENVSGMHAVHRAALALLDAADFTGFIERLAGPAADAMRLAAVRLVLESRTAPEPGLAGLAAVLCFAEPGYSAAYRALGRGGPARDVVLREVAPGEAELFGADAAGVGSEAAIALDLGPGRLPALLVLGAADPAQFRPGQATDLLSFFGGVVERAMRRYLR